MDNHIEIVTVDATNVAQHGFFCYKSKPKSEGYQRKLQWLEERFAEGLRIKILYENGRSVGFIEYLPGEFAWRAVHAPNYVLIIRSDQCPYINDAVNSVLETGREVGIEAQVVELKSAQEVQERARRPTAPSASSTMANC